MAEIRLGAVGSGQIVRSVLDAVAATEGAVCTALCSRSGERGTALCEHYGIPARYSRLEDLLADPNVDFVYLASPNSLHCSQARLALEAGKHVLCEKPLCPTRRQGEALAALAEERGLILLEMGVTPFLPNFRLLREQLPRIGPVRMMVCDYPQYSARYDRLLAGELPRVFDLSFAGGCLMDINYYNLYLATALFGLPRDVRYFPNRRPGLADTSGTAVLDYGGFLAVCSAAKDAHGAPSVQIEGELGSITVPGANGLPAVTVTTRAGTVTLNDQPEPDRWYYEVQNLVPLLLADDRPALRRLLAVSLDTAQVLEEARRSASIPFPDDDTPPRP